MRPIDGTSSATQAHRGGPEVRGRARAAEVHTLKAAGESPSRAHWRERAAATPAVEVAFSPEAEAALAAEAAAATETATETPTETATDTAAAAPATEPAPDDAAALIEAASTEAAAVPETAPLDTAALIEAASVDPAAISDEVLATV
jgi:hypothetical protein